MNPTPLHKSGTPIITASASNLLAPLSAILSAAAPGLEIHRRHALRLSLILILAVGLSSAHLAFADEDAPPLVASAYQSGLSAAPLRFLDDQLAQVGGDARKRRELETALIALLQPGATFEAMLFACQRLAIVGTDRSLPALEPLLASPDTVGMACLALANIPSAKADAALRDAIPQLAAPSLLQVVATLGHRRDTRSVATLIRLVNHPEPQVAQAATLALARVSNRSARRALAALRKSPTPAIAPVLDEATLIEAEALVAGRDFKAARRLYADLIYPHHPDHVRAGAFGALLSLDGARVEDRILSLLDGADPALQPDAPLRPLAIAAVRQLTSARAGLTFAGLLDRLSTSEKVLLIQALADLGPNTPRPALAAQLKHDATEVRLAVIQAFAQLADPADIPTFVEALAASRTTAEQRLIANALIQLPGESVTDRALLAQWNLAPPQAQAGLLNALSRRGSRIAIPVLFAGARSTETLVARAGIQGLGRVATPAELPAMIDLYAGLAPGPQRDDAEASLAQILERMPDVAGRTQAVCAKLNAADTPSVRLALLRLLPLAGGAEALQAARRAATDADEAVRDAAIRALAEWPAPDAADDLISLYRDSPVATHQSLALRGLVRLARDANALPSTDWIDRYRQLLEAARNDDDRRLILGALGGCHHPDALALALEQRQHAAVLPEADQAVKSIANAIRSAHSREVEAALKALAN